MKNIKEIVKNEEWQRLRKSMVGSWKRTPTQNLLKLRKYLGRNPNQAKLRRVHNYLAALRGINNPNIIRMRMEIKEERAKDFLKCLGNGKTIYQCESENDLIDEQYLNTRVV